MLSRVADSLYWMGRYMERAENTARLIDVNMQLMLDLPQAEAQKLKKDWSAILSCLDLKKDFFKKNTSAHSKAAINFLVIDDQPYSLLNQIKLARENARAVREEISTEMWEQLNCAYLWSISRSAHQLFIKNPYAFFYRIKHESHLFQGITEATLPHREAWHFMQLGKYLERAEKTAYFLDHRLFPITDTLLALAALLKSCSAGQAYQKRYQMSPQSQQVMEFLCHDSGFPRSIVYGLNQVRFFLQAIAKEHNADYQKLAPYKALEFLLKQINTIPFEKNHFTIDRFQPHFDQLDEAIFKTYLCYNLTADKTASVFVTLQ